MQTALYLCFQQMKNRMDQNKDYLTELDRAIGDADHGINMARGFQAVMEVMREDETDIGAALKKSAMQLLSKVGGASGPLYGTAFLRASAILSGKKELSPEDLAAAMKAAVEGIQMRGKANRGDKTMLDALMPAYEALALAVNNGKPLSDCLSDMCGAAEKGLAYTETIPASKGRASYLGERSIGHRDPGAASSLLLLEAIRDAVNNT